jgi:hypothetical protein
LQAEHAQARADRKAKLQAGMDNLKAKLQTKIEQAQQRSEQIKAETDAKVEALQQRAAKAQGAAKKAFTDRMAQIRADYEERSKRLKSLAAEKLRSMAAQIEK